MGRNYSGSAIVGLSFDGLGGWGRIVVYCVTS
jgi:hypothetical protein